MTMDVLLGDATAGALPAPQKSTSFLEDWNTQMALSQATNRLSRGSNGQRVGNAMRIVKPTSTSNSPRNSMIMGRRRTLINDGKASIRPAMDLSLAIPAQNGSQPRRGGPRPVSWHPGSQLMGQLDEQLPSYQQHFPTTNPYLEHHDTYNIYPQISPLIPSYSADTSPSSAFSPLPLSFPGSETSGCLPAPGWDHMQRPVPSYPTPNSVHDLTEAFPAWPPATYQEETQSSYNDWHTYITHGGNRNNTSPPTPDSFLQPNPPRAVVTEEQVPYQALDEPEEEGEILVGMGLYDQPEKVEEDPQLSNYRNTVSSLLGSRFRSQEPQGKGLKLEETWEPPKSENGEEEDEDGEGDEIGDQP